MTTPADPEQQEPPTQPPSTEATEPSKQNTGPAFDKALQNNGNNQLLAAILLFLGSILIRLKPAPGIPPEDMFFHDQHLSSAEKIQYFFAFSCLIAAGYLVISGPLARSRRTKHDYHQNQLHGLLLATIAQQLNGAAPTEAVAT